MVVLIVDGYNIIGDWDELKQLKQKDLSQARDRLIELMAEYQAYSGSRVIIVFDAYYVRGIESKLKQYKVEIIYTKEKETADECIERLVKKVKNVRTQIYVATSDYEEQRMIFGQGALRKSARELKVELENMNREISHSVSEHMKARPKSKIPLNDDILEKFEKWRRGKM
ncbi:MULTISPECIES: NYN domain-containing protein [Ornithinibacillus]|uniref:NYN domain-containing protein n=2 Tax=Ornithinibacillus TaxID=484508 RepID=A0A923L8Q1_9BACI|nr:MULTISPECIES: NYN domain-containing protein [Ornithinibacillus]MBC5638533.1 NYN domain-containing protein [Ornithinibacillus hominis]MBS3682217.1 NYN domain-containing protein [Ornithinibacillus massiliensis]